MNKFAVITFPNEEKAYEASRALAELQAEGSLVVFSEAIIAKDMSGTISLRKAADGGPQGVAVGALTGGLIGLLGGPVGAAMGLAGGALIGSYSDLLSAGVSADFVQKVADALTSGTTAIVTEIAEDWSTPLDSRMRELGGTVLRTYRSYSEDDRIVREIAGQTTDLQQLKAKAAQASGEAKQQIDESIDAAKRALEQAAVRTKAKLAALKEEADTRVAAFGAQAKDAASDVRARIDQRVAKAQADYEVRSAELNEAWHLTKDALS